MREPDDYGVLKTHSKFKRWEVHIRNRTTKEVRKVIVNGGEVPITWPDEEIVGKIYVKHKGDYSGKSRS